MLYEHPFFRVAQADIATGTALTEQHPASQQARDGLGDCRGRDALGAFVEVQSGLGHVQHDLHLMRRQVDSHQAIHQMVVHGLTQPTTKEPEATLRFEHEALNNLWQMDFNGHFPAQEGRCHPLTLLDDHSRFSLAIQACDNERGATVKERLTDVFQRFGLPARIIERFHRSLKAQVLEGRQFSTLKEAQAAFDRWRDVYNLQRPHQALDYKVPMDRYRASSWAYPQQLSTFEYGPDDVLAKAYHSRFRFQKRYFSIAKGLAGHHIAIRPNTEGDGLFDVFFCHHFLRTIDVNKPDYGS